MRKTPILVVHCSATPPGMDIGASEIRKWHMDPKPHGNGWSDIGYHWVIRRDGRIEIGRNVARGGAHVRHFNRNTLAVCLVGGIDVHRDPADNFTKKQKNSLRVLFDRVRRDYGVLSICGHRDFPGVAKACPSFSVPGWLYEVYRQ